VSVRGAPEVIAARLGGDQRDLVGSLHRRISKQMVERYAGAVW
jgi:hypothetical protein